VSDVDLWSRNLVPSKADTMLEISSLSTCWKSLATRKSCLRPRIVSCISCAQAHSGNKAVRWSAQNQGQALSSRLSIRFSGYSRVARWLGCVEIEFHRTPHALGYRHPDLDLNISQRPKASVRLLLAAGSSGRGAVWSRLSHLYSLPLRTKPFGQMLRER
jgi:hypothetical protein